MRNRNNQFVIRLDDQEMKALNQKVQKTGFSREQYIRTLLEGYVPHEMPSADYHAWRKALHKYTAELSHLAALARQTGSIDAEKYEEHYKAMADYCVSVYEILVPEKCSDYDKRNMKGNVSNFVYSQKRG